MACFMPFNNRNLDVSFFAFRPTVVLVDDLLDALKHLSLCTETLGCVQSSLIQSIHGNMIIWYGAWLKKSSEDKESLTVTLISMLKNISSMAILVEHTFFDAYAGESRDGSSAAKFYRGDTISISLAVPSSGDFDDLSYACLALFKSHFLKMDGVSAGVCLKCKTTKPTIACFYVWKSLHSCYSWILSRDLRKSTLPYLERFGLDIKYDIFRVVYVSGDNALNLQFFSPHQMFEQEGDSKEPRRIMQN
ncbi:uncharacterized protein LOC107413941 [Ziziphus jujuba]|uniref:Uncharacterized protein LOC107413941 n=2 Tax=Ziziphus jujuba TaxID=326968 RepID=A0A6P3ZH30_ZIZJJ|nr:uncharacterized protein LOC107413941 [Ziziphus jujuba]KAH7545187.1 hypothetical protein FEM48_Zijuj01G0067100 [Ziziphus jujuba var. spinosa]